MIKYKKGSTNNIVDIISIPHTTKITTLGAHVHMEPFTHDAYKEYAKDEDFKEVFQQLQGHFHVEEARNKVVYNLQDELLYKLKKLRVPKVEILLLIEEEDTSKVARKFEVGKMVANLQRYVYKPRMQDVA